jgi:hypothetical protein
MYFIRTDSLFEVQESPLRGRIFPKIHIRDDLQVTLVDQRRTGTPWRKEKVLTYIPSLMKSNLQKAIRRRYFEEAFVTTKHLLNQDANDLLRRLPIMCEDTELHSHLFMEVVWLMAATSKGV